MAAMRYATIWRDGSALAPPSRHDFIVYRLCSPDKAGVGAGAKTGGKFIHRDQMK